jgi:hypothetical protein
MTFIDLVILYYINADNSIAYNITIKAKDVKVHKRFNSQPKEAPPEK